MVEKKNPNRETASRLEGLPNVGKAIAGHLRSIGIDHPSKLIGGDPFELYEALCRTAGKRLDPCVMDICMSVAHFMEGGDPLPWWSFTHERKRRIIKRQKKESAGNRDTRFGLQGDEETTV